MKISTFFPEIWNSRHVQQIRHTVNFFISGETFSFQEEGIHGQAGDGCCDYFLSDFKYKPIFAQCIPLPNYIYIVINTFGPNFMLE